MWKNGEIESTATWEGPGPGIGPWYRQGLDGPRLG